MANVLQNYIPGEAFNTYVLSDLTAENAADWTWEGRTLAGYKTELCGDIPLGGEITIDELRSSISGVWELNKYTLSTEGVGSAGVTLCCLGKSGGITMSVSARNEFLPLADSDHPYIRNLSVTQTSCVTDFYLGTDVKVEIIPNEGTTIRSIKFQGFLDGSDTTTPEFLSKQDGQISLCPTIYDTPINSIIKIDSYNRPAIYDNTPLGRLGNGGGILSVDYVQGGVLEYFSNKNTRNPDA